MTSFTSSTTQPKSGRLFRYTGAPLLSTLLAAALAACGGGGGGDPSTPPPSTPTNLDQSSAEASQAVQFSVSGAAALVAKTSLISSNPLFDTKTPGALAAAAPPSAQAQGLSAPTPQVRPLAVLPLACADLDIYTGPCTGSVNVDTSIPPNATVYPANSFLTFDFKSLSGPVGSMTLSFNGQLRLDFLTALDDNAPTYANARYKITTTAFSGAAGPMTFGPDTSSILVEFDALAVPTITSGDLVLSKISGLTITDTSNYSIGSAQVNKPYWGSTTNKLDSSFSAWTVNAGHPAVGSVANLTASNGATAKVEVSSSSATSIVYPVQITLAGATKRYTVTAAYATPTGTPTYTAVDAP